MARDHFPPFCRDFEVGIAPKIGVGNKQTKILAKLPPPLLTQLYVKQITGIKHIYTYKFSFGLTWRLGGLSSSLGTMSIRKSNWSNLVMAMAMSFLCKEVQKITLRGLKGAKSCLLTTESWSCSDNKQLCLRGQLAIKRHILAGPKL